MLSAVSLCRYSPGSVYAARPGEPASFPGAALGGMDAFRGQFPGPGSLYCSRCGMGLAHFKNLLSDFYDGDLVAGFTDRRLILLPLTAHLRWFPGASPQQKLQPFIGVAAGGQYADFRITGDQINTSRGRSWSGVVMPEAGISFAPVSGGRLRFEAACAWQYASNRWPVMHVGSLRGLYVRAGIRYVFRRQQRVY